jgi:6-phosphogluconolactonase
MGDMKAPLAVVGTYTDRDQAGVYSFRVDRDTGSLRPLDSLSAGQNPSFLSINPGGDTVYAVNETDEGTVRTIGVDRESGALTERAHSASGGDGPCYCSVHPSGEWLFVAHYAGGSVAVLPVDDDGVVRDPITVVEHEGSSADPERQTAAHPHAAVPSPDGAFLLVPVLGTDEVVSYAFDADDGTLKRASAVEFPDGSGPRHLDFGPDGDVAYVITELDSTVATLDYEAETGALSWSTACRRSPMTHRRI